MDIVKILKQPNSSITEDIGDLELGNFTVFAGENNAGKTKLVKVIKQELEERGDHVIYIPAERVIVEAEVKVGAEKDPFRNALMGLIDVVFGDNFLVNSFVGDIDDVLRQEFHQYGVEKHEVNLKKLAPEAKDYERSIKETYIKKFIKSISVEDNYSKKDDVNLSEVGQGMQRLIIFTLLKYIGEKKKFKQAILNKTTYILFEEPEVYLHPKLKESLMNVLLGLLPKGVKVIISTHDPYFIQLATDQKIYRVYRDKDKNSSTQLDSNIGKKYLKHMSYSEVNFQIFGIPSETYFLEIYEQAKREFQEKNNNGKYMEYHIFDDAVFEEHFKAKGFTRNDFDDKHRSIMPMTRLRHNFAHGKNELCGMDTRIATEAMIDFMDEYLRVH